MNEMVDVRNVRALEVHINADGKRLWVNSEDGCLFRAQNIEKLAVNDDRALEVAKEPTRVRMPDDRDSIVHKVTIKSYSSPPIDLYITVGKYPDGRPGEVFLKMGKEGSTMSGMCRAWTVMVSLALQSGIPLAHIIRKFKGWTFEPYGPTSNPAVPECTSVMDYIARWLEVTFEVK